MWTSPWKRWGGEAWPQLCSTMARRCAGLLPVLCKQLPQLLCHDATACRGAHAGMSQCSSRDAEEHAGLGRGRPSPCGLHGNSKIFPTPTCVLLRLHSQLAIWQGAARSYCRASRALSLKPRT